jgi:MFS family permease
MHHSTTEPFYPSGALDFRAHLPNPAAFEAMRAASVAAGVCCATLVGSVYAFSLISQPMKQQFHLSQSDIDIISTVSFMLAQFNLPAGWLLDRFGPRVVNAISFGGVAVGMVLLGLVFHGWIPGTVPTLLVSYAIACWPSGWIDLGTLMPNLYSFPRNRGDIVIIQKTFMGLGASVFSLAFNGCFGDEHVAMYCVCCGIAAAVCGLLAVRFIVSGAWIEKQAGMGFTTDGTPAVQGQGDVSIDADLERLTLLPASEQLTTLQLRGTVYRMATVPAPSAVIHLGRGLLVTNVVYLAVLSILDGLEVTNDWPQYSKTVLAVGAVGLVVSFWSLVLVARWFAKPALLPETISSRRDLNVSSAMRTVDESPPPEPSLEDCSNTMNDARLAVGGSNPATEEWRNPATISPRAAQPRGPKAVAVLASHADVSRARTQTPMTRASLLAMPAEVPVPTAPKVFPPRTVLEGAASQPFMMLYGALLFQLGTGAVIAANGAQIYRASNGNVFNSHTNAVYASVGGLASAFGRISAGALEQHLPRVSVTVYVAVPSMLSAVGLCLFVWLPASVIGVAFFAAQFAYGMAWAVAIMTARTVWHTDIVGKLYALLFTSGIIASAVFNLALFGPQYDAKGHAQGLTNQCSGAECYELTLYLLAAGSALTTACAWRFHVLWRRHLLVADEHLPPLPVESQVA